MKNKVIKEDASSNALTDEQAKGLEDALGELSAPEQFLEAMILVRNKVMTPEECDFAAKGKAIGFSDLKTQAIQKICLSDELSFDELGVMLGMTDMGAHGVWKRASKKLKAELAKLDVKSAADLASILK